MLVNTAEKGPEVFSDSNTSSMNRQLGLVAPGSAQGSL